MDEGHEEHREKERKTGWMPYRRAAGQKGSRKDRMLDWRDTG